MQQLDQKELRHIPIKDLQPVITVLQENQSWKQLMAHIPYNLLDGNANFRPKYTTEHMDLIQIAGDKQNRPYAEILFEEWSTSGKNRPTLKDLIMILMKADLFRAADLISIHILKGNPVQRPSKGPAASIDVSLTRLLAERNPNNEIERAVDEMQYPNSIRSVATIDNNLEYKVKKYENKDKVMLQVSSDTDNRSQSEGTEEAELENEEQSNQFMMRTVDMPALDILLEAPVVINNASSENYNISQTDTEITSETLNTQNIPNFSLIKDDDEPPEMRPFNLSQLEMTIGQTSVPQIVIDFDYSDSCSIENSSQSTVSSKSNLRSYELSLSSIQGFKYSRLEESTNGFDDRNYIIGDDNSGCKIGSGGTGSVYLARGLFGHPVAIKKLSSNSNTGYTGEMIQNQFTSEIKYLTNYQHENILLLLGYSDDGPNPCLIYEYLDGGTLLENISKSDRFYSEERIRVALGIAKGIEYLHYGYETMLIHRDIKSVNVLLTKTRIPKLCDFGLIKQISDHSMTSNIFGTNAYMAPEALRGNISEKMDVFSYGVVLLELLTGLPVCDVKRSKFDIVSYVEEMCPDDISSLVDLRAGDWKNAQDLYVITKQCLAKERERPIIKDVIKMLQVLLKR